MNNHAKKWIEALQSGKFNQTRKVLKDDKGYCCLGVACVLYNRAHKKRVSLTSGYTLDLSGTRNVVKEWLGLRSSNGLYLPECDLTRDNDRGHTFKEIAKTVKKYQKQLFIKEN